MRLQSNIQKMNRSKLFGWESLLFALQPNNLHAKCLMQEWLLGLLSLGESHKP